MKSFTKIISICFFFCIVCCFLSSIAGAAAAAQPGEKNQSMDSGPMPPCPNGAAPDLGNDTASQEQMIKDLESKGLNTTDLKAAFASGDREQVHTVMEGIRDKLPQPPMNGTPGKYGRSATGSGNPRYFGNDTAFQERMVKDLEAQGVDTTELKAAIANGNHEQIHAVMEGFRDNLPLPSINGTPDKDGLSQAHEGSKNKPSYKPASESKTSEEPPQARNAEPTETKSPLSPLTILAGISAAGLAIVSLKRQ